MRPSEARLLIDDQAWDGALGTSIFEAAESVGVRVPTSCRKNGKCRECLVRVDIGGDLLTGRTPPEAHLDQEFRLSCQARWERTGEVRCRTLRRGRIRILESGSLRQAANGERLDPRVRRTGSEVIVDGVSIGAFDGPLLGVAIDVGTTTVVVRLVDLESGAITATTAFENPQVFGGTDIMARIQYDSDHSGRVLQRTLLGYLTHAIEDFGCERDSIFEYVVAGNATMRDLFFGLDVSSIGQRPYRSVTEHEWRDGKRPTTVLKTPSRRLGLPGHDSAVITGLPLISGHVGADTAACLLAIGRERHAGWVALMDIGTNTEFALFNRNCLWVASCPAGPAFEGGAIECGVPGVPGAIESVVIHPESKTIECRTIGGDPAIGICGSGLVGALSELRRCGWMDELGRSVNEVDRFDLVPERQVYLSEADISELAQAKGANVAGAWIVMRQAGVSLDDIEAFYLAGGFAEHLDVAAARRIGLVPDIAADRIHRLGNGAIEGATMALLSMARRRELEAWVRTARHVELETDPDFFDVFVEGCQFRPMSDPGLGTRVEAASDGAPD